MKKFILILLLIPMFLFANIAKVVAMNGEANIIRNNTTIPLKTGTEILEGDVIKTGDKTKLQLIFQDETIITIGKNSEFKINDYLFDEKTQKYSADFGLAEGTFRTITGKIGKIAPDKFKLNSKSSSIGIRGTQILSKISIEGDSIFCTEGVIEIVSVTTGEKFQVKAGEFLQLVEGQKPVVKPFDNKIINTIDTDTKFLSNEEKEAVLESFGLKVTEVETQQNNNTTTNTSNIVQEIVKVDSSNVYDDLGTKTESKKNISGFASISNSNNSKYSLGTMNQFTIKDGTKGDEKITTSDETGFTSTLVMNGFEDNYISKNSFTGTISQVSGTTFSNYSSSGTITFKSGSYNSEADGANSTYNNSDDMQWGKWNVTYSTSGYDDTTLNGYWIAGNESSVSEVNSLISNSATATYKGYSLGSYSSDGDSGNINRDNSSVSLTVDFGAKSVSGNFKFTISEQERTYNVTGSNVTSSGFTLSSSTSASSTTTANGKFYGTNANGVGGNFHINDTENAIKYSGVYNATKSTTESRLQTSDTAAGQ